MLRLVLTLWLLTLLLGRVDDIGSDGSWTGNDFPGTVDAKDLTLRCSKEMHEGRGFNYQILGDRR